MPVCVANLIRSATEGIAQLQNTCSAAPLLPGVIALVCPENPASLFANLSFSFLTEYSQRHGRGSLATDDRNGVKPRVAQRHFEQSVREVQRWPNQTTSETPSSGGLIS